MRRTGDLSRRDMLKLFGVSVAGSLAGVTYPTKLRAQSSRVTPLGTARNCIVIQNNGAPSPPEFLDFKETKYTADDLNPQPVAGNRDFMLSKTLLPRMDVWSPHAAVVRGMKGVALVHFPAQYHVQAGRAFNPALVREIPALGSVIARDLEPQRRESDTFPTYVSFDLDIARCPPLGTGMLPPKYAGLDLTTGTILDTFGGGDGNSDQSEVLSERYETLGRMLEVSSVGNDALGSKAGEYVSSYDSAIQLLMDPRFQQVLNVTDEEKQRYGVDANRARANFGLGMLLARNILKADAGSRFLWVCNSTNGGNGQFDNHDVLYDREAPLTAGRVSVYQSLPRFDMALASLVEDLIAMPGHEAGKTAFDETLIAVVTEFGRTPDMNPHGGRDHYIETYPMMLMGGGVKGGRVLGKTDETGGRVVETGWRYREQTMMDHMTSTIHSALGTDYSSIIEDTPSGRAYEYQQTAPLGGPGFIPLSGFEDLFI